LTTVFPVPFGLNLMLLCSSVKAAVHTFVIRSSLIANAESTITAPVPVATIVKSSLVDVALILLLNSRISLTSKYEASVISILTLSKVPVI
jgi:hypothetical protein